MTLHKKCPYSELFWSVFSHIWTEYGPEKLQIRTLFTQGELITESNDKATNNTVSVDNHYKAVNTSESNKSNYFLLESSINNSGVCRTL